MNSRALLTSWRFWVGVAIALAIAAVLAAGFLRWRSNDPDRILAEPRGPNGELTRSQVERLLACEARDWRILGMREGYATSSPSWTGTLASNVFGRAFVALLPNGNTREKLVHEGRAAQGELLNIAIDQKEAGEARLMAICVLQVMDPYATLQAFKRQFAPAQFTPLNTVLLLDCLPTRVGVLGRPVRKLYTVQDFTADLASKTVDEICLEQLDEAVIHDSRLISNETVLLWWLNRFDGVDFDVWLAQNAPDVLAFRNRELERGYDPVRLVAFVASWTKPGVDEALVKELYPDKSDRTAMSRLLPILQNYGAGLNGAWRATLTKWYTANRSRLVYDPKVMHFVVGPAPVRPEVK